jgi:hypothetical protein
VVFDLAAAATPGDGYSLELGQQAHNAPAMEAIAVGHRKKKGRTKKVGLSPCEAERKPQN